MPGTGDFFFLTLQLENLVGFLKVKVMKSVGAPTDCSPQEFVIQTLIYTLPQAICQSYHLGIPTSLWL